MDTRPGVKPEAFVTELVRRWLEADKERLAARENGPALRGFQWKTLFLPDGTVLRSARGNTVEFAKVIGDRIISDDGAQTTPSMFANRNARGRNAWRVIWLRFPGRHDWLRAGDCTARFDNRQRKPSTATMEEPKTVLNDDAGRSELVEGFHEKGDFGLSGWPYS